MKFNLELKENLFEQCQTFIDSRLITVKETINDIQESLTSETKSSAGDKHETGRAMLQLEREKAGLQFSEIQKEKSLLSRINTSNLCKTIGLGSVVYTSENNYFISISAGKLKSKNEYFYAISFNTPIGQLLMGKAVGDEVVFRGQKFIIEKIF